MGNHNQELLLKWADGGSYGCNKDVVPKMLRLEKEEDRIQLLRDSFYENIHAFEWEALWESETEIPQWDPCIKGQHVPAIVFIPAQASEEERQAERGCVLVAPGGGYNVEADTTEGWPIIERLTRKGLHCALLVYRLRPYARHLSLLDAQRAIRWLRYNAKRLNILKDKIAMLGGSAGGNLTCMCGVHFDEGNPNATDMTDRESCRLNACISMYGTFSACSYPGAEDNFDLGNNQLARSPGPRSIYSFGQIAEAFFNSPEKWVTPSTPPFFLWQTCDEDDPRQMFIFAKALADAGVRFEAHIYPFGRHGLGLADGVGQPDGRGKNRHVMHWVEQAVEWLKIYGF